MKETITGLPNMKVTLFDTASQSVVDSGGLGNDEWFPINFQWRPIYNLKENLSIVQNEMNYLKAKIY